MRSRRRWCARGAPTTASRRAALRSWLYRIATNVCLDLLSGRQRRATPDGPRPAREPVEASFHTLPEVTWIEPVPDGRVVPEGDPAEVAVARETIKLAFVAALQHLAAAAAGSADPPRGAALKAAEVAELPETSVASVNSARSGRATLETSNVNAAETRSRWTRSTRSCSPATSTRSSGTTWRRSRR